MLIAVTAIIFLGSIIFRKNIVDYLEDKQYIIYAGILLLLSFVAIHIGNKESAKVSKEETEKLIKEVADKSVQETINRLDSSTEALVSKSDEAVTTITTHSTSIRDQLDKQLQVIDEATQTLKFLQENQDVLVQVKYEFLHGKEPRASEIDFYNDMCRELLNGNTYELTLISNNKESEFISENSSFRTFNEEFDEEFETIENTYASGALYNEHYWSPNPQIIKVNYLLNVRVLSFHFKELKVGDNIEFRLRKSTSGNLSDENSLITRRRASNKYFKEGFASFVPDNGFPKASVSIRIMTRDGHIFSCKNLKTDRLSPADIDYGFITRQEVVEIIEPGN